MKKILTIVLFITIFLLGTSLRFYKLGDIPNSLDWDEASWGYNAFSILATGKDEYGSAYPLSFKAFGDYKQPVYVYAEILPMELFGVNAFSVRFPSAFFGSFTVPFVFLLVYELFRKKHYAKPAAFLSMLFLAISPWQIQFSRVAFESVLGLFFVVFGVWVFLRGLRLEKKWYFFASAILLALSAYSYHAQKLFTPILVVGLILFAKDYFLKHRKLLIIFGICFVLFNSLWLLDSRTTARGKSVLFTSDQTQLLKNPLVESNQDAQNNQKFFNVVHNRRIIYAEKFVSNYVNHFNLNWLFVEGDLARHHAPGMGLLYLVSLPFILMGIYFLLTYERMNALLLGYWFLLAPIAGSLVTGSPNAERALIMLPIWQILEAFGFMQLVKIIKKKAIFIGVVSIVVCLYLFSFVLYTHQYFHHTNTDFDRYWQYGYQQAVTFVRQPQFIDKKIYFAQDIEQGYIFYLFYNQIDPKVYLASGGSNRLQNSCYSITNAYFGTCNKTAGDIFVTSKEIKQHNYTLLKTIPYSFGDTAVFVYTIQ